jgi:hypothetical protein
MPATRTNPFNRTHAFAENVRVLEHNLRMLSSEVPVRHVLLTSAGGEERELRPVKGSHNSVAFFYWLSKQQGKDDFLFDGQLREIAQDFYAEHWNQPGHETIAFLRESDLNVEMFLKQTTPAG